MSLCNHRLDFVGKGMVVGHSVDHESFHSRDHKVNMDDDMGDELEFTLVGGINDIKLSCQENY